jgi:hypothetical protein
MSAIRIKHEDAPYPQVPALLLGRLGVDKDARCDDDGNKNYHGYTLIDACIRMASALKKIVGCRYIRVDAYPDMVDYYRKKGFETEVPDKEIQENVEKKMRGEDHRNILMYFRLE